MTSGDAVLDALAGVRDPELDEPLTTLGFVASLRIDGGRVEVHLRLPTYFCAPNFTYLMVAGARDAVLALPDVDEAAVVLDDHFAAEEINAAVAGGGDFSAAFPGETEGSLEELRVLFMRKAFVARQGRVCEDLLRAGTDHEGLASMRLGQLPPGPAAERLVALREELGLDASPDAPAFVRPDGARLTARSMARWLRLARLVRLSLEGNGGLCRGLLRTRYGLEDPEEVVA